MNKRASKGKAQEAFSSLEKRKMVEEIWSGRLTIKPFTNKYQLTISNLQAWHNW